LTPAELEAIHLAGRLVTMVRDRILETREHAHRARAATEAAWEAGWGSRLLEGGPVSGPLLARARHAGAAGLPVVVVGEPGSGKEALASLVHRSSPRALQPFVTAPCAEPAPLLEQVLFGAGGALATARGGTLYLELLHLLSMEVQTRLVDALPPDQGLVASLETSVEAARRQGLLLGRLAERLAGLEVHLPPLRERPEEIVPMAQRLLARAAPESRVRLASSTLPVLEAFPWPGNVRELQQVMEEILLDLRGDLIRPRDLPGRVLGESPPEDPAPQPLAAMEHRHIELALQHCGGNLAETARVLGISRARLYRKLERYGISREPGR
jgi:DNA-binding NtrC family response regulator